MRPIHPTRQCIHLLALGLMGTGTLTGVISGPGVLRPVAQAQQTEQPGAGAPDAGAPAPRAPEEAPKEVEWVRSVDAVSERAEQENKLIFAYFYATWCPYCKQYDQTIVPDPSVRLLMDEFVATRIDGDRSPDMVQHYKVTGFPATVLVDPEGKEVSRSPGLGDPAAFSAWMGDALAKHSLPRLEQQAKANPEDLRMLAKMAIVYAYKGDMEKAEEVYNWVAHKAPEDSKGLMFPIHRAMATGYRKLRQNEKVVSHLLPQFAHFKSAQEKAQASLQLGVAYWNLQQWAQVIPPMEYVVQAGPREVTASQKEYAQRALQEARNKLQAQGN